jgi:hypothetical protein
LESRNEHPTSNIEQPMFHAPAGAVLWMLVGVSAERRRLSETIQRRSAETPLRRIIIEVKP